MSDYHEPRFMVSKYGSSQLLGGFDSNAEAERGAQQLALESPSAEFIILKTISSVKATAPVEWKREIPF